MATRMISATRTDLSIDSEGNVYRDVAGSQIRVSWVLLDGTRKYYTGRDGVDSPATDRAVRELIGEWGNSKPIPVKGMGVTYNCGSDRYAYTIIEVLNEKTLVIQEDKIVPDPEVTHKAVPNEFGRVTTITLRKNGCWYERGSKMIRGCTYTVGKRRYYMDPGF
jgi:hypothetical protein